MSCVLCIVCTAIYKEIGHSYRNVDESQANVHEQVKDNSNLHVFVASCQLERATLHTYHWFSPSLNLMTVDGPCRCIYFSSRQIGTCTDLIRDAGIPHVDTAALLSGTDAC